MFKRIIKTNSQKRSLNKFNRFPFDVMQQKQKHYAIIRSVFMIIWEYCVVALAVFMKTAVWDKIVF